MRLARPLAVLTAASVCLALSACATIRGWSLTPQFGVNGSCTTKKGTLTGVGSGFTNNGQYQTIVTQPDKDAYPKDKLTKPYGLADAHGNITTWTWPCKGDSAGTYTLIVKDSETGIEAHTTFEIAANS